MRSTSGAFFALAVLGGYFIWRNRFGIQRQLESMGVRTPVLKGGLAERAKSVVSKVAGKMDRGARIAEHDINRASNY